jgi:murein L,D-transpeptidase YafK
MKLQTPFRPSWRLLLLCSLLLSALVLYRYRNHDIINMVLRNNTVGSVLAQIGPANDTRWASRFAAHDLSYPPSALTLLALKEERQLEIWSGGDGVSRLIHTYPIFAASGAPGPKLREGDGQVPEGIYNLTALNPNSAFHLSIRVDYPNDFDRARAVEEGRTEPGTDIFLHGSNASIGCIAIGDPAIEEVFTLLARTGLPNCRMLIAPHDLRTKPAPDLPPSWTRELYAELQAAVGACCSG